MAHLAHCVHWPTWFTHLLGAFSLPRTWHHQQRLLSVLPTLSHGYAFKIFQNRGMLVNKVDGTLGPERFRLLLGTWRVVGPVYIMCTQNPEAS